MCGVGGSVPVPARTRYHENRKAGVQERLVFPKEVDSADIQDCQGKRAWTADDAAVCDVLARKVRVGFKE